MYHLAVETIDKESHNGGFGGIWNESLIYWQIRNLKKKKQSVGDIVSLKVFIIGSSQTTK